VQSLVGEQASDEALPTGDVLDLVEEVPALLAVALRVQGVERLFDQVQVGRLQSGEPLVLELEVEDTGSRDAAVEQVADGAQQES
jgi:hypothetical protein